MVLAATGSLGNFYSCFDHSQPQASIMKVRADMMLGENPIHNSLFLSLGSEPREREEWQVEAKYELNQY